MASTLDIRSRSLPGEALVIELAGTLDAHTGQQFAAALAEAEAAPVTRIVIDLARLEFIASAGIGALIACRHRLAAQGRSLRLAAASPGVADVFAILGLDALLPMHAHVVDALGR